MNRPRYILILAAALTAFISCQEKPLTPAETIPDLVLAQDEFTLDASRQTVTLEYTVSNPAPDGYAFVTKSSETGWIYIPEADTVVPDGKTLDFTVMPNESGSERSASLIVEYCWNGGSSRLAKLVTVTQQAGSSNVDIEFSTATMQYYARYSMETFVFQLDMESLFTENHDARDVGSALSALIYMDPGRYRQPAPGTYVIDDSRTVGSVYIRTAMLTSYFEDGTARTYYPQEGTVTISEEGGTYTVEVEIVTTDGLNVSGTYTGSLELADMPEPDSDFTQDIDLTDIVWTRYSYYYDDSLFWSDLPNYYFQITGTADIGNGEEEAVLVLQFYPYEGREEGDMAGTYPLSSAETLGTLQRGYRGNPMSYLRIGSKQAAFYDGALTVTVEQDEEGNTITVLSCDFYDFLPEPNHFTGSVALML